MQDLRFAFRQLLKNPGFTTVAVLTLALGIGANTAVFSLINTVLLKPISGREPERLVGIYSRETARSGSYRLFSHPNYTDLRAEHGVFDDVLAYLPSQPAVTEGDIVRRVLGMKVSANYFSVFGVQLAQGRTFLAEEETQPAPVVIVSYAWWQKQGRPDLVGQSIRVNGRPMTIVGIAPRGFTGTIASFSPELFLPLVVDRLDSEGAIIPPPDHNRHELMLVGRLKRDLTVDEANARLKVVSARLSEAYPDVNRDQLITVARLPRLSTSSKPQNDSVQLATVSALVLSLSCLVLLIACLNLANMFLAPGAARRKEFAVRLALGARAGRLVRQLMTEGFVLAGIGGLLGLVIGSLATGWLATSMTHVLPASFNLDPRPDFRVLSATLGFCVLAMLVARASRGKGRSNRSAEI